MIKICINDAEMRFWGAFPSVVEHQDWLEPGFVVNLWWVRIEVVKWWVLE